MNDDETLRFRIAQTSTSRLSILFEISSAERRRLEDATYTSLRYHISRMFRDCGFGENIIILEGGRFATDHAFPLQDSIAVYEPFELHVDYSFHYPLPYGDVTKLMIEGIPNLKNLVEGTFKLKFYVTIVIASD